MTATSGRKCFEQYEKYNPLGLLVKTLLESSAWYNPAVKLQWKVKPLYLKRLTRKHYSNRNMSSKPSAVILSVKDIPSSRLLFRLVPSVHLTEGTGCGLLPTVQTQGLKVCNAEGKTVPVNLRLLPTPTASEGKRGGQIVVGRKIVRKTGNVFSTKLSDLAKSCLLPTPVASDATTGAIIGQNDQYVTTKNGTPRKINQNGQNGSIGLARIAQLLPTPQARDCKGQCHKTQSCLPNHFGTSQLNPLFVEEMMGFPLMWSVLPFLSPNGGQGQSKDMGTP